MDSTHVINTVEDHEPIEAKVQAEVPQAVVVDVSHYLPLYKAALRGDWDEAKKFFEEDDAAMTVRFGLGFTALHLAIGTGSDSGFMFVKNLVDMMLLKNVPPNQVTNEVRFTVLHIAACVGNTKAAELLVSTYPHLLYATDHQNLLPIHRALYNSQRETFLYLLEVTRDERIFEGESGVELLGNAIHKEYFDVSLYLVKQYPHLATTITTGSLISPLFFLSKKAHVFPSGCHFNFLESLIYKYVPLKVKSYKPKNKNQDDIENPVNNFLPQMDVANKVQLLGSRNHFITDRSFHSIFWKVASAIVPHINYIKNKKSAHLQALELLKCLCTAIKDLNLESSYAKHYPAPTIQAASNGAYEVIEEIIDMFPQAVWSFQKETGHQLFQLAIINRCEKVYNLIFQMSGHKIFFNTKLDDSQNTLLHLAARMAPKNKLNLVSGAALQMQRELQWFEEVKKFVYEAYIDKENSDKKTAKMLFTEEHEQLVKDGEEWIKKTADSYTITAALITTIVFAAAITVPGGNNGNTGAPIYSRRNAFIIFAISDAISLFSSTTSLLLFLSILTARYAEQDFLITLPKRLIIGLATLFLSTTSMMIAFSATLYLMFGHGKAWIIIPIAALTCLPITSFVTLQFPLLTDLISSTYGGIFVKQSNRPFY